MSYILDALRKSEAERYQERLPELGGQQPLWLRQRRSRSGWPAILAVALMINGGLLAYWVFTRSEAPVATPELSPQVQPAAPVSSAPAAATTTTRFAEPEPQPAAPARLPVTPPPVDSMPAAEVIRPSTAIPSMSAPSAEDFPLEPESPLAAVEAPEEEALLIAPNRPPQRVPASPAVPRLAPEASPAPAAATASTPSDSATADPHAGIPLLEQLRPDQLRGLPALRFSSHIYSSDPDSRRIMINQRYLREGQTVQGVRVVEITEEGVILSHQGLLFHMPVLRDWVPDGG